MSDKVLFIENAAGENRFLGMSAKFWGLSNLEAFRWDGQDLLFRRTVNGTTYWARAEWQQIEKGVLLCLRHAGDPDKKVNSSFRICYGGMTPPDPRREPGEYCINRPIVDDNFLTKEEASQLIEFARKLRQGTATETDCPAFLIPPVKNQSTEDLLQQKLNALRSKRNPPTHEP